MKRPDYRYLFGPVPSRRFGRSLGIDLTPHKTCTLDCVFCQLGRTPARTFDRRIYVPTPDVVAEAEHWLAADGEADYLTLSGSGEPTLHAEFGRVLMALQDSPIPTALLTNGTLFHLPEVRKAAALADVVKVSLSAWDQRSFDRVNRPHPQLAFENVLDGLKRFRQAFDGQLWLEVFLLTGINATARDVEKIARLSTPLHPDRIHLNTVVRPPAEGFAAAVPPRVLEDLCRLFDPPAVVAAGPCDRRSSAFNVNAASVLAMLKRRPCTGAQIQAAFGMHMPEVAKILGDLIRRDQVLTDVRNDGVYYRSL